MSTDDGGGGLRWGPVGAFDRVEASGQAEQLAHWMDAQRRLAPPRLEPLDLRSGDQVLDLGCGPGSDLTSMAEAVGPEGLVVGLDLSATMVRRASARAPTAAVLAGDGQHLPFASGAFDACWLRAVTPDLRRRSLSGVPRQCRRRSGFAHPGCVRSARSAGASQPHDSARRRAGY